MKKEANEVWLQRRCHTPPTVERLVVVLPLFVIHDRIN